MKAYSEDLRSRVLAALDGGISQTQAAQTFQVSVSSIRRWRGQLSTHGHLHPKRPSGRPRKIEPLKGASKLAPDLNRRKEPLEAFPLESLAMVGTLQRGKSRFALVRTTDKDVYQVKVGNYMGQNFGVVIGIEDTEIKLKELVQDGAGDWTERSSTIQLAEADQRQERRK